MNNILKESSFLINSCHKDKISDKIKDISKLPNEIQSQLIIMLKKMKKNPKEDKILKTFENIFFDIFRKQFALFTFKDLMQYCEWHTT